MKKRGKLLIGTSGWAYNHWKKIFYPEDLPSKDKLKYFSKYFKTTEINYSFYHLPSRETFQKWYQETPADFVFSVKASRFITHIKRLKDVEKPWKIFFKNALNLKEKLGPILFQFPPNFKCNTENLARIKEFLIFAAKFKMQNLRNIKSLLAIEVRNSSFENDRFFSLLKKYNTALVISNSPTWKEIEKPELTNFIYIRMHGSKTLFSSNYTKKELNSLAEKIKKYLKQNLDVYVYFNNDAYGFALENAKELLKLYGE